VATVKSLAHETFLKLRDDIVAGRIRPNERLIAGDLAEEMQISRTPVREALQLLEAEDLIVGMKRGYVVREHSRDEIVEIYEVRAALEGMAARLVAEKHSAVALGQIEALGAHNDSAASRAERDSLVDLNTAFHAAIIEASGNARLARMNRSNSQHFFNYRIAALYTDEEALAAVRGHAVIVQALRAGDPDAAERAARLHVVDGLNATLAKLR
jgi:DNA-binding GntR family transcriptional regulator